MNQYLKTFMSERSSLIDSISNQSSFINDLINLIDEGSPPTVPTAVNYSSITSVINLTDQGITGEYELNGETNSFNINLDDINQDTVIPGMNISIGTLLNDVSSSQKVNSIMAHINDVMLNYGEISVNNANSIIDSFSNGVYSQDVQTLKNILSSVGAEVISKDAWLSILYNFNKEVKDVADNGHLVLDTTSKVVAPFVGTAVLQLVGTIISLIGLVLAKVNVILGLIVSTVGILLNWVTNTAVSTNFEVNPAALNYNLRTPIVAGSLDAQDIQYANADLITNNGVFLCEDVGLNHYMWFTKTNDYISYINSFMDMSVDTRVVRNILLQYANASNYIAPTNNSGLGRTVLKFYSDGFYVPAQSGSPIRRGLFQFWSDMYNNVIRYNHEDVHLDISTMLTNLNNDDFWYDQIILTFALVVINGTYVWSNVAGGMTISSNDLCSLDFMYNFEDSVSNDKDAIIASIVYFLMNDNDRSFIRSKYFSCLNSIAVRISQIFAAKVAVSDLANDLATEGTTYIHVDEPTYGTTPNSGAFLSFSIPWVANKRYVGNSLFTTQYTATGQDLTNLQTLPDKHFINWPDYSPDALARTLLILASATIIGSAVGFAVRSAFNSWKLTASVKSASKVSAAREQFLADPTSANARKFSSAQRWYNFKAGLFGWNKYDGINGWYSSSSDSNSDQLISDSNSSDLELILRRIGSV